MLPVLMSQEAMSVPAVKTTWLVPSVVNLMILVLVAHAVLGVTTLQHAKCRPMEVPIAAHAVMASPTQGQPVRSTIVSQPRFHRGVTSTRSLRISAKLNQMGPSVVIQGIPTRAMTGIVG